MNPRVHLTLTPHLDEELEKILKEGTFRSKQEIVMDALRKYFGEKNG